MQNMSSDRADICSTVGVAPTGELIKYLNIILSYNIMQLGILQTHNKYEYVQNLHISTCNYASQREAFDHFAFASKFS